jgi:hypothetical protein
MLILTVINLAAWAGAALMLGGSVLRVLRGCHHPADEFLAALSLISALFALFFSRRLFAAGDEVVFAALSILSLALAAYVYRLGWGYYHGRR